MSELFRENGSIVLIVAVIVGCASGLWIGGHAFAMTFRGQTKLSDRLLTALWSLGMTVVVVGFLIAFAYTGAAMIAVVLDQYIALAVGALVGLWLGLPPMLKPGQFTWKNLGALFVLLVCGAFLASMGWIVLQGIAQCRESGTCGEPEDYYRGR